MRHKKNNWLYHPPSLEKWSKRLPLNDDFQFVIFKDRYIEQYSVHLFYEDNTYALEPKFEQGKIFFLFTKAQEYCETHFKRIHKNMLRIIKQIGGH